MQLACLFALLTPVSSIRKLLSHPFLVAAPSPPVWKAFTSSNQISISWSAVTSASSYVVKWKDKDAVTYTSGSIVVTYSLVPCTAKDGSPMLVSYQYQTSTDSSNYSVPITFLCASGTVSR